MSVAELQKRLSDLHFSLEETVKAFQNEQDASEEDHQNWEDTDEEEQGDEPDVIDHDAKINALENAKDKLNEAIEALDAALED